MGDRHVICALEPVDTAMRYLLMSPPVLAERGPHT